MLKLSTIKLWLYFSATLATLAIAIEPANAISDFDINDSVKKFTASDDEATLINQDVAFVSNGNTKIYIGTNQVDIASCLLPCINKQI